MVPASARPAATGALVGLSVSAAILLFRPSIASPLFAWLIMLPAVTIGMVATAAGVSLRDSLFPRRPDAPRVARAEATTVRDYVSPGRLRAAPALVLIAGLVCSVGALLGTTRVIDSGAFLRSAAVSMLVVAFLVLLSGVAWERRVLRETQPVAEELELAWDDAFRAETFRTLRMLEAVVAWLAIAAAGIGILDGVDASAGTQWSTGLGLQLYTWGYLAILLAFSVGRAQTFFRHRLWPRLEQTGAIRTG